MQKNNFSNLPGKSKNSVRNALRHKYQIVQAMDYAYTLQGWIKGVNAATLDRLRDMGKDGLVPGLAQFRTSTMKYPCGLINYFPAFAIPRREINTLSVLIKKSAATVINPYMYTIPGIWVKINLTFSATVKIIRIFVLIGIYGN